jgi:dTDP-glucose pyrophosphorylase
MRKINLVIPMAGAGSRFVKEGYTTPKPLIEMAGKPMIQWALESFIFQNAQVDVTLICQQAHIDKYNLKEKLERVVRNVFPETNFNLLSVDKLTEGAACTVLISKDVINNDQELIIADSDHHVKWSTSDFIRLIDYTESDGAILNFISHLSKWSFCEVRNDGFIYRVEEKNPISPFANVGVYYFRKGKDFVFAAEKMIENNLRINNEFYVAPVYNMLIEENKHILAYPISPQSMFEMGTPDDMKEFIKRVQK